MNDSLEPIASDANPPVPAVHSLTRHTAYYLIGRIATGAVGLLALVAFTRLLSPADYGEYAVIIAVAGLVSAVGFQWLRQCLVRFATGVAQPRQPLLATLGALFLVLFTAMLVVSGLLVLFSTWHVLHLPVTAMGLAVIAALVALESWFELAVDATRVDFKPWRYGVATFARAALTLVLGSVAAWLTHRVLLVVLAMAVAYLVSSPLAAPRWLSGLLRVRAARRSEALRLARYGLPLAGTLGMTFILGSADRLMLAGMRGYTEAGVYSSAYNLAQFSTGTLLAGIGLGSLPLAVGVLNAKGSNATARLLGDNLTLGVAIALPAATGLILLAPGLDKLLLGNYVPGRSGPVTMIVAAATALAALRSYCVDVVFMLHQRTWVQALIIGGAALLNVMLNWVWIPHRGAVGAALATMVAFVAAFLGSWFLSRRYLRIHVAIADMGKVVLACAAMAMVLIALAPNAGNWLRLVVGVAVGAISYGAFALLLDVADSRHRVRAYLSKHIGSVK